MILTKDQIIEKRNRFKVIENFSQEHHQKYEYENTPNPGQFFLYETIIDKNLTYPKLGIYLDSYVIDMAIEHEWVDVRRTWEYKTEYEYVYNGKNYTAYAYDDKTAIKSIIAWNDQIYSYGVWDKKPTWKELKPAYEQTLWFKRTLPELRNLKLDNILR